MSEPDNLVLELLRGMREDIRGVREELKEGLREVRADLRGLKLNQDKQTMQLEYLDEKVEMLRESTMVALGFSTDVGVRQKKMAKQVADLAERVEKLEKAK
jgi:hypothetical protein